MIEQGSSGIYTNTIIIPRGTPVALSYQYGMDYVDAGGPVENEALQTLLFTIAACVQPSSIRM